MSDSDSVVSCASENSLFGAVERLKMYNTERRAHRRTSTYHHGRTSSHVVTLKKQRSLTNALFKTNSFFSSSPKHQNDTLFQDNPIIHKSPKRLSTTLLNASPAIGVFTDWCSRCLSLYLPRTVYIYLYSYSYNIYIYIYVCICISFSWLSDLVTLYFNILVDTNTYIPSYFTHSLTLYT
jgi:hypothetical protein